MDRCENIYHCIAITGGLNCPLCELDRLRAELTEAHMVIDVARILLEDIVEPVPFESFIFKTQRIDKFLYDLLGAKPAATVQQPAAVCDDCGSPCTQANNAKSHFKRCAACQLAFIASLDAAITAQHAVPIGNSGCNYLSLPGFVCRKCGAIHGQSPDAPASTPEAGL